MVGVAELQRLSKRVQSDLKRYTGGPDDLTLRGVY